MQSMENENIDPKTVASFGDEWARFDQTAAPESELQGYFDSYFRVFPWGDLPTNAEGFDMGCGSGRWARFVAPRVGTLHCVEPSAQALAVAQRNLAAIPNIRFHHASVDTAPLTPASQDFGYSLGVLHHIPDTQAALQRCVHYLKPGAPFLLYLYYRFDNRPAWFRVLWALSDVVRRAIHRLPSSAKHLATDSIALLVYWPLARLSLLGERLGLRTSSVPLYAYRHASLYTMRTDSRDRFGTPLEQRFTRQEITQMMQQAGLQNVTFSEAEPYWCAVGIKS
jgi:SAM-dependent methyltransferase